MSDRDFLGVSDEEHFDRLMMQADLANKEARERFACAICDPDVPGPDVDWCNVCSAMVMPSAAETKRQRDELLAALELLADAYEARVRHSGTLRMAREAIAKATKEEE